MLKTVKEMYESAVLKDTALLSTYNGDFWNEYIVNHKEYDRLFMRMFKSFKYFLQDGNESIDDVLTGCTFPEVSPCSRWQRNNVKQP